MLRFGSWITASAVMMTACQPELGVLSYDTPPIAAIKQPFDGAIFSEGEAVSFVGQIADDGPVESLEAQWLSDLDQLLVEGLVPDADGIVTYNSALLTPGNHTITLWTIDSSAQTSTSTVGITVVDQPEAPEVTIVHPAVGEPGTAGFPFEFVATVFDVQDDPELITAEVTSDVDGFLCEMTVDATGVAACDGLPSGGDHFITVTAWDTDGYQGESTVYFAVTSADDVDNDLDGFTESQGDCDDTNPSTYPAAIEVADRADNDCDGIADEGTEYYDDDGDGFCEEQVLPCTYPDQLNGDCDDTEDDANPNELEVCFDNIDNNCSGTQDEAGAVFCVEYYMDADNDGYGNVAASLCLCGPEGQYTTIVGGDCDDSSAAVNPVTPEAADRLDNNCNGLRDEGTEYYDDDGDGYCEATTDDCTLQAGQTFPWSNGDCNDNNAQVSPAAAEVCSDGIDNDCSGATDDGQDAMGCSYYYADADQDGYGADNDSACFCYPQYPYTETTAGDCYDSNGSVFPYQTAFFETDRGDGSFDYNCNGTETKLWTDTAECDWDCNFFGGDDGGWSGGTPSCGQYGTWFFSCGLDWFDCVEDTESRVQLCQ